MEVILLKGLPNLGVEGHVVEVKDGYARNYLLPYGYAVRKTKKAMEILDSQKEELQNKAEKLFSEHQAILDVLRDKGKLIIEASVGEADKLFGSVTSAQISEALKKNFNVDVDKRQISLRNPIRSLGSHTIFILLDKKNQLDFLVEVRAEMLTS